MKLAEWARSNGVSRQTATRWFHSGDLPASAIQLRTGTILIEEPIDKAPGVALYARVSSSDQKNDLDRQVARLVEYATGSGISPTAVVSEIGSGLNGHCSKLLRRLGDKEIGTIVVEHRDRLARFGVEYRDRLACFGVEYLEAALSAQGRILIVVDDTEVDDDLVRDMVEVLTWFCARLYGRRSAKRRAEAALAASAKDAA